MKHREFIAAALMSAVGSAMGQTFHEDFDNVTALAAGGWSLINASTPLGVSGWYQGSSGDFAPQASPGFIETDFTSGSGIATLNNWLLTPTRMMQNGDSFQFWTRCIFNPAAYPDRVQIRLSLAGTSANIGVPGLPTSVGDFTLLLLDINPNYTESGYPGAWTQYSIILSGLPHGGAQGRLAFRYFVENGGPLGIRGAYVGIDSVDYTSGGVASGACCLMTGACVLQTGAGCTLLGGVYRGDGVACVNANCPIPMSGSCCKPDGSCIIVSPAVCLQLFGVYGGDGIACGAAPCQPTGYVETSDAGGIPATAAVIGGPGTGPLTTIFGHIDPGDTDMFRFRICDAGRFSASTLAGTLDTQLFVFDTAGRGIVMDDDGPNGELGSIISGQRIPSSGVYCLAISLFNRDPKDSSSRLIWNNTNPAGQPYPEWVPDGPGAANPVSLWTGVPGAFGDYAIALTGACFDAPACYANCDASSVSPILNANDFQCFLNRFGAEDPYANCDGSSSPPVLNANDFQCYLNIFAAGCS